MNIHLLGGEREETRITVVKRSYPESQDFWDANWLDTIITIKIPGYSAHFDAQLRTDEFRGFYKQLTKMDKQIKGKAEMNSMEGAIEVCCKMNGFGQLSWQVKTQYPVGTGAVLDYEFTSDQSFLPPLIKELTDVLENYQVLGNP